MYWNAISWSLSSYLLGWIVTLDVLKWGNKEIKNRAGQVEK